MSEQPLGLEELPTKALVCLVDLLDYKSRTTCRLVSKTLKRYVDQTGLSVKIDTRQPGSTHVAQSVRVTEAVISYLDTLDWSKKYLENWKTVILSGYINEAWFAYGLQRICTNLRVLIIHEKCITSQDFIPPTKVLPFIFDHLTQLQIFLSENNFIHSIGKNRGRIPIPGLSVNKFMDKSWKKIDSRIRKNMIYLLQTIRSRVLKVLHIFVYTLNPVKGKVPKICWEHEPLFQFLQYHHATLEEVHMPNLLFDETESDETGYKLPGQLQTLTLTMRTILTYWKTILLNQNSLQNLMLHVGLESRPVTIFYFILLNSVVSNNAGTLVCIRLAFSNPVRLNVKMFQVCQSLEYFAVESVKVDLEILNLNQLPLKCLTSLEMMTKITISSDFNLLQFLKDCRRPRYLRFMGLANDSQFNDPKYMLEFMKLVLRCRTLNVISMVKKKKIPKLSSCQLTDPAGLLAFLEKATVHSYHSLNIWDINNFEKEVKKHLIDDKGAEYVMDVGATNLNYLETVGGLWMMPSREQPFNFPRNVESYVVFKNQKTGAMKIEAQYRPFHERETDVDCIRVLIDEMKT